MTDNASETTIRCSACGQPFATQIYSYIDVTKDPSAKARLLSGQVNSASCPHCGTQNTIATPLLYHDPTKELLIAFVPMEMNMNKDEQERAIGQLMNRMPKDNFKGYMFNPTRAITMQGLVEQVLEADGVTKEMIEQQRERVNFVQQFIEAESEAALQALVAENDSQIDDHFFQTMTAIAQRVMQNGQAELAEGILAIQQRIVELSSFGKALVEQQQAHQAALQKVADDIQRLGPGAQRQDFLELALRYADDPVRLQALVTLVRPAMDYEFFQVLTLRIAKAPAAERETLETVRDTILQISTQIDQQQQAAAQEAAGFLQAVVNHEQPQALIEANSHMIDDLLMQVLDSNIQQAEQKKDIVLLSRLREVQQMILNVVQSQMQPELRFINDLLEMGDEDAALDTVSAQAADYGQPLLEMMDAVHGVLKQQGNVALLDRLNRLQQAAQKALSTT